MSGRRFHPLFFFFLVVLVSETAATNLGYQKPRPDRRPAEYVFEHPFTLYGHKFKAVVLLPSFYGNVFGPPDDVDQLLAQYPSELGTLGRAHRIRARAQRWLWAHFQKEGTFSEAFLDSPEFIRFASAEQFDDGRSALVYIAVDDGNEQDHLLLPIDIRAMLRTASPRPSVWGPARGFNFEASIPNFPMPFVLRGMQDPTFAHHYKARPRSQLHIDLTPDTEVVLGKKGRPTMLFPIDVDWPRAFANEFKSWSHRPMRVQTSEGGKTVTKLIDFLPMLLRIAEIYKMYSRTAYTLADVPFPGPGYKVDEIRAAAVLFAGRKVPDSEIGILPAEYWLECTTQQACDTYEADFDFKTEIEWWDPHLPLTRTRAMRVTRSQWFQAFPRFIQTRPGKALFQDAEIQLHHKVTLVDRDIDPNSCGARMRRHTAQRRLMAELNATSM